MKKTIETKKHNINTLEGINALLGKCSNNKDVKPSTGVICMRIKKEIEKILASLLEERDQVMKDFNLSPKIIKHIDPISREPIELDGYDWTGHKDDKKITGLIDEINKTTFELQHLNELSEEEVIRKTKGLNDNEVSFLWDYLVKF